MKHLRRCFCVLLCFVLLLGVFSVNVKAVDIVNKPYHIYSASVIQLGSQTQNINSGILYPNNGEIEKFESTVTFTLFEGMKYVAYHNLANDDGTILFKGGREVDIRIENVMHNLLIYCHSGDYYQYLSSLDEVSVTIFYADSSVDIDVGQFVKSGNTTYTGKFKFTPEKDVIKLCFNFIQALDLVDHYNHKLDVTSYLGEFVGDTQHYFHIEQSSKEEGLLSGIWGAITDGFGSLGDKVTNLWTAITDGFSNMGNKLTSVWTAITDGFANMGNKLTDLWNTLQELPSKLWGLIENGLKGLFVPDEDYITDVKARIEEWAERTWGGMYQAVVLLYDVWDSINDSQFQNTIEIPETTINLTDGNSFTFGGWVVPIVPDGFEFLANIVRWVIAVFATLFFINGLRKRYDRIFGG